ncbi:MAG TPA: PAS domain S-box protein, partial [Myxococcota bacterium]|nr:PAS domain S-box protein [Myxococcota bacterium]
MADPIASAARLAANASTPRAGESSARESSGVDTMSLQLIRTLPVSIAVFDRQMRYLALSDAFLAEHGLVGQELIGRSHYEVFPDIPERWRQVHARVLEGASESSELDRYERADGSVSYLKWECRPWRGPDGSVIGALLSLQDLSSEVSSQEALRAGEARFRSAMQDSPVGMAIVALDGRVEDANPALCAMLGYTLAELRTLDFQRMTHPEDLERDLALHRETLAGERANYWMRKRYFRKDGAILHADLYVSLARREDGSPWHFISHVVDLTERLAVEEARRESEDRLRIVAGVVREVFWLSDVTKQKMLYVSPAYERVWGDTVETLFSEPLSWLERIHEEDRERVRARLPEQLAGDYDVEYRIVRADGAVRWIHDRAFPVRDERGEVTRIAGVAEDVTERKRIEEQYRQSQRMEAVGQLAGGVAHDFNNMLAIILLHVSVVKETEELPEEVRESLDDIDEAAQRAANLTRQLLQLSRREVLHATRIDINEVVERLLKIFRRTLGEAIEVRAQLAPQALDVFADPSTLEQVLMNLVINARDAMPHGGRLVIETGLKDVGGDEGRLEASKSPTAAGLAELEPGRYVWLRVSDNGQGIPPELLPKVFEPFVTTKGGKGTGLGLATVFGIVRQHRGAITVYSTPGLGTTFQVFLPFSSQPTGAPVRESSTEVRGGEERILLVEDDPMVRKVTR